MKTLKISLKTAIIAVIIAAFGFTNCSRTDDLTGGGTGTGTTPTEDNFSFERVILGGCNSMGNQEDYQNNSTKDDFERESDEVTITIS